MVRRRSDRPHFPGRWDFPGGHVEEGESPSDALVRELREELGVVAQVSGEPALRVERQPSDVDGLVLDLWVIDHWRGEPTNLAPEEHDDLHWMMGGCLDHLPLTHQEYGMLLRDLTATTCEPWALLITGTVGVGKTTTADAVGTLLAERGIPHAVVDLDAIRRAWPSPADDPFQSVLELRNLSDLARNFLAAGARVLVFAGVVETATDRQRYAEAVGIPLLVCRLTLDLTTVRARLLARHADDESGRVWHLNRSSELDAILTAAQVEDVLVSTSGHRPVEVAAEVLDRLVELSAVDGSIGGTAAPQPQQAEDR